MFAARAGAAKVIGIDCSGIIDQARRDDSVLSQDLVS